MGSETILDNLAGVVTFSDSTDGSELLDGLLTTGVVTFSSELLFSGNESSGLSDDFSSELCLAKEPKLGIDDSDVGIDDSDVGIDDSDDSDDCFFNNCIYI